MWTISSPSSPTCPRFGGSPANYATVTRASTFWRKTRAEWWLPAARPSTGTRTSCKSTDDVRRDLGPASMVFNNAGVDLFASAADMSWEDFDWLIAINIGGVVNGTKAFLPQLIEAGSPQRPARLVNTSSAFGLIAFAYQSAYSTSKFAVRGLTEAIRQEMIIERHPVTVHCVHPGVVRSNFGTNMRTADTEDRDKAVRLFQRAALTSPEKTARLILRGIDRNRARIVIGPDGWAAAALPRLLGARYTGLMARAGRLAKRDSPGS